MTRLMFVALLLLPGPVAAQDLPLSDEEPAQSSPEDPATPDPQDPTAPGETQTEADAPPLTADEDDDDDDDLAPPAVTWEEAPADPVEIEQVDDDSENPENVPRSPVYALQKIEIKGARKTMDQVILRYVDIRPGVVFAADDHRLEMARYRLLASGLFHDVQLSLKRGTKRGWAVLVITVKERNTIVVKDLMLGFSEITPYGSLGVSDGSFLGTGVNLSATAVMAKEQFGYLLALNDDHFLNSDFGVHFQGRYAKARDFFGHEKILVDSSNGESSADYAVMNYRRAGVKLGTSYNLLLDYFFFVDFRFEAIYAAVPPAASHYSFGERRPIEFGHLLPGDSLVSSILFGLARDTSDHFLLPSDGSKTEFSVEISSEVFGSNYEFSKFTLSHDTWFPLGKGHSIKLGLFAGLIMGEAPFFDQFFVGDFSALVPSRLLGLNFSHLQPSMLGTSVQEMRYEDMVGSIALEYSIPFYRGDGFVYGVNGFVGLGAFAITSSKYLRTDPKGYQGFEVFPMDLTADFGIKVDTRVGIVIFSLANVLHLIPPIKDGTTK